MATINHSSGADIIVPSNGGTTYRGLGGDDTYILSNSIAANAAITIVDTSGSNTIQLVNGLSVAKLYVPIYFLFFSACTINLAASLICIQLMI